MLTLNSSLAIEPIAPSMTYDLLETCDFLEIILSSQGFVESLKQKW